MSPGKMLVDNAWVAAARELTIPVVDPSTGEAFTTIARGDEHDVDRAVTAAQRALSGEWGRLSAWDRGRILLRTSELIRSHHAELAAIESRDTGKTQNQAAADVTVAARYFEYFGGLTGKLDGYTIPFEPGYQALAVREPHGVTAHIIPWNYPAQMFARDASAALAAGNAMVMKPAEDACLCALRMGELMIEAGLPRGALNIVTGLGVEAGAALARHHGVEHLSFTGSPQVGSQIQAELAKRNRSCTMELGGKSPQIVFADADLDQAIGPIVTSIVMSAGQTCSAGSRLLVERSAYDTIVQRVVDAFSKVRCGTPAMNLESGPVVNDKQRRRVEDFINTAIQDGVPVLARGSIAEGVPKGGYFVTPTLFGPVPRQHRIAHDEVFGPVLSVLPFTDEADAIALANGTDYGLVASIWTRDGARQLRVAKAMKCGQVFVNGPGYGGNVELPFGGVKRSGFGREKGLAALAEYSTLKTILIRHG
jgi:aldehyde dehydrogenase (NAD+)